VYSIYLARDTSRCPLCVCEVTNLRNPCKRVMWPAQRVHISFSSKTLLHSVTYPLNTFMCLYTHARTRMSKGELVSVHNMRAYEETGGAVGTRQGWVMSFTSRPLLHQGRNTLHAMNTRLGGLHSLSRRFEKQKKKKTLVPFRKSNHNSLIVQPVA